MDVMAELNKLSIYKPLSEDQVRDMVGAPSIQEQLEEQARYERNECVCGEINCKDEYAHTTSGY
tara:strand:+ start:607 stop:798 length:192 start_codon:yes stop_codon:yes gene_type:complete